MSRSFDFMLAGISLIVGIMLMTGNGSFFMKVGNSQLRKKKYDEKKMEKGSGLALILIGVVTFIDSYTTTVAAKIGYIVVLAVMLGGLVWYIKNKWTK